MEGEGRHLPRPARLQDQGRKANSDRPGTGLGQLGRRPLVMAVVDAWTVEEEEEVESPEVALHERLYWSMAAAREPMD